LNAETAIWADSISKRYRSGNAEVVVFDHLSLKVARGEKLAIIGESGAGKSTLLHLLGGLDRPSEGAIYFGDEELTSFGEAAMARFRNREIGFVWQNPSLLPEFTALENVMMPLLIRGETPDVAARLAGERLVEVGLGARLQHRAGELSGGEQQRVALARALVAGPKVLMADEPTGNLDFRTGETIIGLLADLHRTHRLTSLFVTHNVSFAQRCDRVLELRKGTLHTPSLVELQEAGFVQDATRLDGGTYV
jgi:lipoprotein-releasing system ATP-binding protein